MKMHVQLYIFSSGFGDVLLIQKLDGVLLVTHGVRNDRIFPRELLVRASAAGETSSNFRLLFS